MLGTTLKASNVFFILLYVMYIKHMVHMRSIIDMQPMFRCWFKSETQMCDMSQEFGSRDTVPKQHAENRSPWDDVYYTYFFKNLLLKIYVYFSLHWFIHPSLHPSIFTVACFKPCVTCFNNVVLFRTSCPSPFETPLHRSNNGCSGSPWVDWKDERA